MPRAPVAAAPDERSKHRKLAKVLALSGQLDELDEDAQQMVGVTRSTSTSSSVARTSRLAGQP